MLSLTSQDKEHLATLEGKLQHIRDAVRGIVKQFHTGLILYGEGGTSKSFTVIEELQRLKAKYIYHNTRLTARGLVDSLAAHPNDVHFIEDAETLLDDKKSFGVLRSALWSQSKKKPPEREISWKAFNTNIRVMFTGGIIIISNANLAETIPEIRAIKTRINVLQANLANEEILALMKKICLDGYAYGPDFITPAECWEVCEFVVSRLSELRRNLDLRLLINGFRDYLQWKTGNSVTHWKTLLEGRMKEAVVYRGRAEVKGEESKIALEIHSMPISLEEKLKVWEQRTGNKGKAGFYRALGRTKK